MKTKIICSLAALVALGFTACDNEEPDLFPNSAAERTEEAMTEAKEGFASNGGKWVMQYFPTNDEPTREDRTPRHLGYTMALEFGTDSRVRVAMRNDFTGNLYKEDTSAWEILADNGPSISFNTYNECLHAFSDPGDISFTDDDETGKGCEGDYEFSIISLEKDGQTALLKGKKRLTYQHLTRLPADTDLQEYINDLYDFKQRMFSPDAPNTCTLTVGGTRYTVGDVGTGLMDLYLEGTSSKYTYYPYSLSKVDGKYRLLFRDGVKADSLGESKLQEMVYDEAQDKFFDTNDENNVLEGGDPVKTLYSQFEGGKTFSLNASTEMSDALKAKYNDMVQKLKDYRSTEFTSGVTLKGFTLSYSGGKFTVSASLTAKMKLPGDRKAKNYDLTHRFLFDMEASADGLSLSYAGAEDANQENLLNDVPQYGDFVKGMAPALQVSKYLTSFDLSVVKVTRSNPEEWFVAR